MSTQVVLLYIATWSLVAISPGPAVICAMTQAARYGMRAAMTGIVGIQIGHLVFFGAVACGLSVILAAASSVFALLRVIGAVYLLYLGVRIISRTFRKRSEPFDGPETPQVHNLLLQGFAIQITNPKALLCMAALLPQFIHPETALGLQMGVLLASTIIIDVLVLGGYAFMAHRGARTLKSSPVLRWLERAFGGLLVFFGIRLLITCR